jgi:AcrR family transcriptional regulator
MRADARRNYERLLNAAREVFSEDGAGASLDDIARRANVGPGTLYRHFPTREALLAAVYRGDVERLVGNAKELAAANPPLEALQAYLRAQLEFVKAKRGLGSALKAMLADDSATLDWCRAAIRAAIRDLLTAAQDAGEVRTDIDAPALLRLVHGIGIASESAPDEVEQLLTIVVDGLRR